MIVVLCLVLGLSLCAYYLKRTPRIYSTTATLQIEQNERKIMTKVESVVSEDLRSLEQLNTIAQRLRAHSLLERVILTNKLDSDLRFLGQTTNTPSLQDLIDHGDSFELCKSCIDGGFTSVMIDGSHFPFKDNIELTRKVVEYAHPRNVTVEGELGKLAGVEDEVKVASDDAFYTDRSRNQ